jgi:hypothetical protein
MIFSIFICRAPAIDGAASFRCLAGRGSTDVPLMDFEQACTES